MLSQNCDSGQPAVSKILQGTVCVPVTHQPDHPPTKQSQGLDVPFAVGPQARNEYSSILHSCFQPVLCKPPSSEVETGTDGLFLGGIKTTK